MEVSTGVYTTLWKSHLSLSYATKKIEIFFLIMQMDTGDGTLKKKRIIDRHKVNK